MMKQFSKLFFFHHKKKHPWQPYGHQTNIILQLILSKMRLKVHVNSVYYTEIIKFEYNTV